MATRVEDVCYGEGVNDMSGCCEWKENVSWRLVEACSRGAISDDGV